MQRRKHFQHPVGYFDGIGAALFLHHNHGPAHTIIICDLRPLLKRIVDTGNIAQVNIAALERADNYVGHLVRRGELALYAQGICIGTDVEHAAGDVAVLSRHHRTDLFYGQVVGFKPCGVDINMYLTFGST